jgi:hypothetical protein
MKRNYNDYIDQQINSSEYHQRVRLFGKEEADRMEIKDRKDRKIGEIMVIIQVIAYTWLIIYFK